MKLAIVVGHNSASQGAVRQDTGESEFVWNGRLARRIERLAGDYGLQVRTFFRTPGGGYSTEISRTFHRHVLTPDADLTASDADVAAIAGSVFTDEAKAAYAAAQAASEAQA